ncbi:hypothetical protein H696_00915 [Fonticula alba]|uniref:Uncharacterized protein n=1 Tax=Fonticula alba TaxID=691883 RepID=A0A058ZHD8_FONAL|nr:hypothetical protein H696_00915 [Fonticula alba]KCV73376.1 hypothetical protein H696_00915 [Fonticula alba]|eukprot:XP_009493077.1 hypothetical protein H696_00915 [Fonticula alba]
MTSTSTVAAASKGKKRRGKGRAKATAADTGSSVAQPPAGAPSPATADTQVNQAPAAGRRVRRSNAPSSFLSEAPPNSETEPDSVALRRIMMHPDVNIKQLPRGLFSANISEQAFFGSRYDDDSVRARGLFVELLPEVCPGLAPTPAPASAAKAADTATESGSELDGSDDEGQDEGAPSAEVVSTSRRARMTKAQSALKASFRQSNVAVAVSGRGYAKFFYENERGIPFMATEQVRQRLTFPCTVLEKSNGYFGVSFPRLRASATRPLPAHFSPGDGARELRELDDLDRATARDFFAGRGVVPAPAHVLDDEIYLETTSKSVITGPFAGRFRELLHQTLLAAGKTLVDYVRRIHELGCSAVFEIVDPVLDPHIVDYDVPGYTNVGHVILLDLIRNNLADRAELRLPFEETRAFAVEFGLRLKTPLAILPDWDTYASFTRQANHDYFFRCPAPGPGARVDPGLPGRGEHLLYSLEPFSMGDGSASTYHVGLPTEGLVVEDSSGFMIKLKSNYYNVWKRARSLVQQGFAQPNPPERIASRYKATMAKEPALIRSFFDYIRDNHAAILEIARSEPYLSLSTRRLLSQTSPRRSDSITLLQQSLSIVDLRNIFYRATGANDMTDINSSLTPGEQSTIGPQIPTPTVLLVITTPGQKLSEHVAADLARKLHLNPANAVVLPRTTDKAPGHILQAADVSKVVTTGTSRRATGGVFTNPTVLAPVDAQHLAPFLKALMGSLKDIPLRHIFLVSPTVDPNTRADSLSAACRVTFDRSEAVLPAGQFTALVEGVPDALAMAAKAAGLAAKSPAIPRLTRLSVTLPTGSMKAAARTEDLANQVFAQLQTLESQPTVSVADLLASEPLTAAALDVPAFHSALGEALKTAREGRLARGRRLVLVMQGVPGIGKSTIGDWLAETLPRLSGAPKVERISQDMCNGKRERFFARLTEALSRPVTAQPQVLIIDRNNHTLAHRGAVVQLVRRVAPDALLVLLAPGRLPDAGAFAEGTDLLEHSLKNLVTRRNEENASLDAMPFAKRRAVVARFGQEYERPDLGLLAAVQAATGVGGHSVFDLSPESTPLTTGRFGQDGLLFDECLPVPYGAPVAEVLGHILRTLQPLAHRPGVDASSKDMVFAPLAGLTAAFIATATQAAAAACPPQADDEALGRLAEQLADAKIADSLPEDPFMQSIGWHKPGHPLYLQILLDKGVSRFLHQLYSDMTPKDLLSSLPPRDVSLFHVTLVFLGNKYTPPAKPTAESRMLQAIRDFHAAAGAPTTPIKVALTVDLLALDPKQAGAFCVALPDALQAGWTFSNRAPHITMGLAPSKAPVVAGAVAVAARAGASSTTRLPISQANIPVSVEQAPGVSFTADGQLVVTGTLCFGPQPSEK